MIGFSFHFFAFSKRIIIINHTLSLSSTFMKNSTSSTIHEIVKEWLEMEQSRLYDLAFSHYQNAILLFSKSKILHHRIIKACSFNKQYKQLLAYADMYAHLWWVHHDVLLSIGIAHLELKDYQKAQQYFMQLYNKWYRNMLIYYNQSLVYQYRHKYTAWITWDKEWIARYPYYAELRLNLWNKYYLKNSLQKALSSYKKIPTLTTNHTILARCFHNIATCYQWLWDNTNALTYYTKATQYNPLLTHSYKRLAIIMNECCNHIQEKSYKQKLLNTKK